MGPGWGPTHSPVLLSSVRLHRRRLNPRFRTDRSEGERVTRRVLRVVTFPRARSGLCPPPGVIRGCRLACRAPDVAVRLARWIAALRQAALGRARPAAGPPVGRG